MTEIIHQVSFVGVRETYPLEGAVECRYAFGESFEPTTSDWIGLYRVGWRSHDSYETYVWVQLPPVKGGDAEHANREASVIFPADVLPKDSKEFYQFCYVSSAKQVCGVSTPFQLSCSMDDLFEVQDPDDPTAMVIKTKSEMLEDQLEVLKKDGLEMRKEVQLLQLELDAERASKGKLMDQLKAMAELREELDNERKSRVNLLQQILELQHGLQAERRSNELLHSQLRAMRDELQADRRAHEEALLGNQSRVNEERMLESQTGASCEESEEAAIARVDESEGVVSPPNPDNADNRQRMAEHVEANGGGAEAKSLSLTERITEDFDDEMAAGPASGTPDATNKSEESLKACPVCNAQFPAGASEAEITQHVEHHNGPVCPICFMQFDVGYPEQDVMGHVNRHLDNPVDVVEF